jgi:hypothetical protein
MTTVFRRCLQRSSQAEADIEMNRRLDRILDLLSNPTPELQAAIDKNHRKSPDYDAICQRVMKSLTLKGGL